MSGVPTPQQQKSNEKIEVRDWLKLKKILEENDVLIDGRGKKFELIRLVVAIHDKKWLATKVVSAQEIKDAIKQLFNQDVSVQYINRQKNAPISELRKAYSFIPQYPDASISIKQS